MSPHWVVIVTGASRGFGRAVAQALGRRCRASTTTASDRRRRHDPQAASSPSTFSRLSPSSATLPSLSAASLPFLHLVLVSRSLSGVQATAESIMATDDESATDASGIELTTTTDNANDIHRHHHPPTSISLSATTEETCSRTTTSGTSHSTFAHGRDRLACTTHVLDFQDLDHLEHHLQVLFYDVVAPIIRQFSTPMADHDPLRLGDPGHDPAGSVAECDNNESSSTTPSPPLASRPPTHVVLINNHGSLGYLGSVLEGPATLRELQRAIDLNVTSSLWLSTQFARFMRQRRVTPSQGPYPPPPTLAAHPLKDDRTLAGTTQDDRATIVNVSSLVAIQPFPTMSVYSAGKAARDCFHQVLAQEQATTTAETIQVLNYAPGPMRTAMAKEIQDANTVDDGIRAFYQTKDSLISPDDSANVLVRLLLGEIPFRSGQHVDYFDVVQS